MSFEYILATIVTPFFLVLLSLLLFPSFLTPKVIQCFQASITINSRTVRVIHILLISTGLYFLSALNKIYTHEIVYQESDYTDLAMDQRMEVARSQRNVYLGAVLYVGLGTMGFPIAGVISKHFPVSVWNRTTSKTQAHAEQFKTTPLLGKSVWDHDLSHIDVMFTCLPTSKEVQEISEKLGEQKAKVKPGLVWLDNTSGEPAVSKVIGSELLKHKVHFMDTPISGGRKGATNSALTISISGNQTAYDIALPVLKTMGKNITYLGTQIGTAHAWKGINNLLYGCNLLLAMKAAQAFEKQGINCDKALKAVMTSSGGCNAMARVHEYVTHNRTIDYSFLASFLIKDMNIGLSLIDKTGEDDPTYLMFTAIRDLYIESANKHGYHTSEVFDAFQYIENTTDHH